MKLAEALDESKVLGVPFGTGRATVVERLGDPENWTDSEQVILKYGDLQLTFDSQDSL